MMADKETNRQMNSQAVPKVDTEINKNKLQRKPALSERLHLPQISLIFPR